MYVYMPYYACIYVHTYVPIYALMKNVLRDVYHIAGAPPAHGEEGLHRHLQGPELHRAPGALRRHLPARGHAPAHRVQEPRQGEDRRTDLVHTYK